MYLASLGPGSRSRRWMHKPGNGSWPISGAETVAGHFQNNKWTWQAGMPLCSNLSQASVEDLIPELWVAVQPNLRGLLLVLQDGLRRLCQSPSSVQLGEWKNKRNLTYKSNLSLPDIYKSSELWSPLLRACLCPRGVSIQQGGGVERQSSDFSQFLSLIFFLSYQEGKQGFDELGTSSQLKVHEPT